MGVSPEAVGVVARVRGRVEQLRSWVATTLWWRIWERLLENEFIDRSVALAAKAFVSFFPSLIVVAAFMPSAVRDSIFSAITRRAGLSGEGLATVRASFATADDVRKATGILGLLLTFFYINSFITALQRVYVKAWRRPATAGMSKYALSAASLVAIVAYFALIGGVRALFGHGPQTAVFALLALVATVAVWSITPFFMLQRQVRLRALVATGILTGIGIAGYAASASLWMPTTVTQNQHQFGFFGVALALVTWLTGTATVIVVGACAGAVLAEDTGVLGRLARGSETAPALTPGAVPSLAAPPPSRTFADALGRHDQPDEP